jgi:hypothetical protein
VKEQAQFLMEAIARGDKPHAESLMSVGMSVNPDNFIELLRKEGILRFARYDFQTKTLVPLVESVLRNNSSMLGERCQTYLKSVIALGLLAPAVRTIDESARAI